MIVGGTLGVFLAVFGWRRFLTDFWPLDNSRIGPNLVASFVVAVLVIGHNEYRTALKAVEEGRRVGDVVEALEDEVLHPAERAEQHIADHDSP